MFTIECPDCRSNTMLSLAETGYEGPYRCWRCKSLYMIRIANEKMEMCQPMSEEELEEIEE